MVVISRYLYTVKSNVLKYIRRAYVTTSNNRCERFERQECTSTEKTKHFDAYSYLDNAVEMSVACNGMRLVCEYKNFLTVTLGCFVPAGSMYETCEERGSALFLEHLLFRRTKNITQQQLELTLEEMGGRVSAIAMRDIFLFYGTVPSCKVEQLMELFANVILCGVICEGDVNRQKCVILNQLNKIESDKEQVVMDYLPTIAYQDTPLGNSVYPETDVIKKFCRDNLVHFRDRLFKTCSMTMISVGCVPLAELERLVKKYFANDYSEPSPETSKIMSPCINPQEFRYSGADMRLRDDDDKLGYVAIGIEGPGCKQPDDHLVLNVAKEFVGSWDETCSGANHNAPYIAHNAYNTDLCRMYKSFFNTWSQSTSLWGCYFVCDKMSLENMTGVVQREWMRLCMSVTKKEIERAVNQCKTKELLILNDPLSRFLDIVRNLFRYGRHRTVQQRIDEYEDITVNKVREVCLKYIYDQSPAIAAVGRIENLPDYINIRNGLYLVRY